MDHPGYEIIARDDVGGQGQGQGWYVARALGGVPVASMRKRTAAVVLGDDGERIGAELLPMGDAAIKASGGDRLARLRVKGDAAPDLPSGVMFDLPDFMLDGDVIRMRAADDLAGCGAIIAALERLSAAGARADFYAVFTRAEEGGLFGARLMAEAGTLPKDALWWFRWRAARLFRAWSRARGRLSARGIGFIHLTLTLSRRSSRGRRAYRRGMAGFGGSGS